MSTVIIEGECLGFVSVERGKEVGLSRKCLISGR